MTCLPDVNVWIALTIGEHIHHAAAARWFKSAANDAIAFCRVTQMSFLRLLTNNRVMAGDVLTAAQAWEMLERFRRDDRVTFLPEPLDIEGRWRKPAAPHKIGANFWTDTYLAAFSEAAECTLITFDRRFKKHKRLRLEILSPASRAD